MFAGIYQNNPINNGNVKGDGQLDNIRTLVEFRKIVSLGYHIVILI